MQYIYVAGPYTKGCQGENAGSAIDVGEKLLQVGYSPYIPHLTLLWAVRHPHSWDEWLRFDESWLLKCDALVRIPGESDGADREVQFAKDNNIPVFFGLDEFFHHVGIAHDAEFDPS